MILFFEFGLHILGNRPSGIAIDQLRGGEIAGFGAKQSL